MDYRKDSASLALGIIGLTLDFISLFVCGWLSILGAALGLIGMLLNTQSAGKKVPAIVALTAGAILFIIWLVMILAIYR